MPPFSELVAKHNRPGERNINLSVPLDLSITARTFLLVRGFSTLRRNTPAPGIEET